MTDDGNGVTEVTSFRRSIRWALAIAWAAGLWVATGDASAAICTSGSGGTWFAAARWSCGRIPLSTDDVVIGGNHTVNVDAAGAVGQSLDISTGNGNGGVAITVASGTLTIGGNVSVNAVNLANNRAKTLNVGAGTLSVGGSLTLSGSVGNREASLLISTGTATVTGSVLIAGTNSNANITFSGAGTLNVGGNLQSGATFTASTGTVNFNGGAAQQIGTYTYNILKVNNAAGATLTGATTTSALTIGDVTASSVFDDGGFQLTSAGTLNLTSGTFRLGSATTATTFPGFGTLNISAGTTVEYAAGVAQTVSTTPAYQNLTFSGAGTKTTAAGTLSVAGNWSVGSTTALNTNNTVVSVTGNFAGTGSVTQGTGLVTLGGDWTNTGTFTASSAGVTLTGSGKQITGPAGGISFTTLTVDGTYTNNNAGTITVSTALSGTGTLTQGTNATLAIGGTSGIAGLTATANPNTVVYNGSAAQTVKATTYHHLTINNASGVSLAADTTVNGTLTLQAGNITTGASTVITTATCASSVSRPGGTPGHVIGRLQKAIPTGNSSCTFEVGDATGYTPVDTAFTGVTVAGNVLGTTATPDHPNISTSGINSAKSVNRYWTLTTPATGSLPTGGSYDATFNFLAGDVDGGASTGSFIVKRFSGGTWSSTTTGTRTATSTQATGLTGFGDFAVGEPGTANFSREKEFIYTRELY
ncbi:MAG: hypothetical protein HYU77_11665 [Betaproteobacteria bacterium]|nr:hypothetical protein [Betaproteobacteria bacterium]